MKSPAFREHRAPAIRPDRVRERDLTLARPLNTAGRPYPAAVLALQRVAGNAAVTAMLADSRPSPRTRHEPTPNRGLDDKERDAEAVGRQLGPALPSLTDDEMQIAGRRGGLPIPERIRRVAEGELGTGLPPVRLHDGPAAHRVAGDLSARAVTHGADILFARTHLNTSTAEGRALLGHELAHVGQQNGGPPVLQRAPDHAKDHHAVSMHFDGRDLIVTADGTEVYRFSAQSGRPVPLRPEDAAKVGADPVVDSYMNDKRFTWVQDLGPIPEGTYQFNPKGLQRFTAGEQLSLLTTSHSSTVTTATGGVSGGDWGSGRVALSPVGALHEGRIPGANKRSGFFLHGGIMAGSSGCIDIGTSFSTLADWLEGYGRPVRLTVTYEHEAPTVGPLTGLSGMIAYRQGALAFEPRLGVGAESSASGTRPLLSPQADVVLKWAGGSLSAGARFDASLTGREQFIRLGLQSTLNLRLFQHLFTQFVGGYSVGLSGSAGSGWYAGAGLQADFGRVQLGLLYDQLSTSSARDPQVHQALFNVGLRFP